MASDRRPSQGRRNSNYHEKPQRTAENTPMYDAICSQCGDAVQVPFKPDPNRPLLCKSCLQKSNRRERPKPARHDRSSQDRARAPKSTELYEITCSHCGKHDTIPFKPYEDSAVLCHECMNNPNIERVGGKIYHTIICSVCGKESKVPFKPDPGSRVLCHDCHVAERAEKQRSMEYFSKNHPSVLNNTKVYVEIRCEKCGAIDTLPFVPKTHGAILCRQCAENTFGDEWAKRNRVGKHEYPFTCARCAAQDFVPFKPKPGQELLCKHCLNDEAILKHKRSEMQRHDEFTCVRSSDKKDDES